MSAPSAAGTRIRLRRDGDAIEAALLDGETLLDHALWRPDRPDGWGELHLGRVQARAAALGGRFVALAPPAGTGFLPDNACGGAAPPAEGAAVPVRITRSAQGGKGPRLALDPADQALAEAARRSSGRPPLRLRDGPNPIAALLARAPDARATAPDPALAALLAPLLAPASTDESADRAALGRIAIDARPDEAAEAACDALRHPVVALPGGARATITPTPALVAIDVDSAGAAGAGARPHALLAVNRALLPALVRELRLRNLSGAIVIDLAGLPARKRAVLAPELALLLAADPLKPRWLGFSALGFAEINRPRTRPPLHEVWPFRGSPA